MPIWQYGGSRLWGFGLSSPGDVTNQQMKKNDYNSQSQVMNKLFI